MTTVINVTANAHKTGDGQDLECVVTTIDNLNIIETVIENGKTQQFSAYENRAIIIEERIKVKEDDQ